MILKVDNLKSGYGPVTVLRNVTFTQQAGEVLGIVGHNGMGKTTLLRTLMGVLRTNTGAITFRDQPVTFVSAHRRSHLGIAYVPQGDRGFPNLTVLENLKIAAVVAGANPNMPLDAVLTLFPRLEPLLYRQSVALSGGERQLLAIARAIVRSPHLLLLDEMTEGVQPSIVDEIAERLRLLQQQRNISMLIVDQDLAFVAALCTRALVMHKGTILKEVTPAQLITENVLGGFVSA